MEAACLGDSIVDNIEHEFLGHVYIRDSTAHFTQTEFLATRKQAPERSIRSRIFDPPLPTTLDAWRPQLSSKPILLPTCTVPVLVKKEPEHSVVSLFSATWISFAINFIPPLEHVRITLESQG